LARTAWRFCCGGKKARRAPRYAAASSLLFYAYLRHYPGINSLCLPFLRHACRLYTGPARSYHFPAFHFMFYLMLPAEIAPRALPLFTSTSL